MFELWKQRCLWKLEGEGEGGRGGERGVRGKGGEGEGQG